MSEPSQAQISTAAHGPSPTEQPTFFPYQGEAIQFLASHRRAMLVAGCGTGKTRMAVGAVARVIASKPRSRKVRVGWVANTRDQCAQAAEAFALFPRIATAAEVTIVCPAAAPTDWNLDVLIVDECHHSAAASWAAIIRAHQGALWMLTATPWCEDEERNTMVREFCGGHIFTVARAAAASRTVAAHVHLLSDTDSGLQAPIDAEAARKIARRMAHGTLPLEEVRRQVLSRVALEMGIIGNAARNAAVVRVARIHGGDSTLILVPEIAHGERLAEEIGGAVVAHSKMGARARREAISAFKAAELKCLVATSLADEGLDCPVASVLILAAAGRSANRVEQRCGRVLRAHPGKDSGLIYDFTDGQHPLLARWSQQRRAVYRRLGYRIHAAEPALELASFA